MKDFIISAQRNEIWNFRNVLLYIHSQKYRKESKSNSLLTYHIIQPIPCLWFSLLLWILIIKKISILSNSDCKSYDISEKRNILFFKNSVCELIKIKDMEHIQNPKDNFKIGNKILNTERWNKVQCWKVKHNNKASNPNESKLTFLQKYQFNKDLDSMLSMMTTNSSKTFKLNYLSTCVNTEVGKTN